MPKNNIKAKNTAPKSNKATGRDYAYDKAYEASAKRVKYREDLNAANRKAGTYGKMTAMGKDRSHTVKNGKIILTSESSKLNRARNGRNGKSTYRNAGGK